MGEEENESAVDEWYIFLCVQLQVVCWRLGGWVRWYAKRVSWYVLGGPFLPLLRYNCLMLSPVFFEGSSEESML